MDCTKPFRVTKNLDPSLFPDGLEVPCGKCYNCRVQKRREWSVRMLHESVNHEDSVFTTLTYSDENLPEYASLKKDHLQKFIKRLRKSIQPHKIRYFACGEYGDESQRPHYHLIIFGLSPLDKEIIDISWGQGIVHAGTVEPESIQYVAKYIDKKYSGPKAEEEYQDKNREPVFRLMSLGLGRDYVTSHGETIAQNGFVQIKGQKLSLPRYYIKKLEQAGIEIDRDSIKQLSELHEIERVEKLTGFSYTRDEFYKKFNAIDVISLERRNKKMNVQTEKNRKAKSSLHRSKL